jgi:hypothetical protein
VKDRNVVTHKIIVVAALGTAGWLPHFVSNPVCAVRRAPFADGIDQRLSILLQQPLEALTRLPGALIGILLKNTRLFRQNIGLLAHFADFVC